MRQSFWGDIPSTRDTRGCVAVFLSMAVCFGVLCSAHFVIRNKRNKKYTKLEEMNTIPGKAKVISEDVEANVSRMNAVPEEQPRRSELLDFLRGLALYFVVCFHFLWDLRLFSVLPPEPLKEEGRMARLREFTEFWTVFVVSFGLVVSCGLSTKISADIRWILAYGVTVVSSHVLLLARWWACQKAGVGLIMICIGMSSAYLNTVQIRWDKIRKRLTGLGVLAAVISLLSWIANPREWVYFGAVHCIVLLSLLHLPLLGRPYLALAFAFFSMCFTFGWGEFPLEVPLRSPTLDYIPWFHNLGFVAYGIWLQDFSETALRKFHTQFSPGIFVWMGRNALAIYVLHQFIALPAACFFAKIL